MLRWYQILLQLLLLPLLQVAKLCLLLLEDPFLSQPLRRSGGLVDPRVSAQQHVQRWLYIAVRKAQGRSALRSGEFQGAENRILW